jgi:hypothetical protein
MSLVAKWPAVCAADCGRPIEVGEVMERCPDKSWVHASCDPTFIGEYLQLAIDAPFGGWPASPTMPVSVSVA